MLFSLPYFLIYELMAEKFRETVGPRGGIPERTWVVEAKGLDRSIKMFAQAGDRHPGENILCQCRATSAQIRQCERDLIRLGELDRDHTREYKIRLECYLNAKQHMDDLFDDE